MRIFHGPISVTELPWVFSRAQRKLGHTSDFIVFDTSQSGWLIDGWDKNLNLAHRLIKRRSYGVNAIVSLLVNNIKIGKLFTDCLKDYDVFHFYSGWTLFPGLWRTYLFPRYWDLPILRSMGKRIVFYHIGCRDGKLRSRFSLLKPSVCAVCKVGISGVCTDEETIQRSMIERKYGHVIITGIPDMSDLDQFSTYLPTAIDLEKWQVTQKMTSPPKDINIVQVTGNFKARGDIKGVSYTEQAVKKLQSEGHPVKLTFVDKVSSLEMPSVLSSADIVVDNLLFGWYGLTGIQAMALGKPVVAYLREPWLRFHCMNYSTPPVVNSDPEQAYHVLKRLISNYDLSKLGQEGRRYVEDVHNPLKIGQKLIELYESGSVHY